MNEQEVTTNWGSLSGQELADVLPKDIAGFNTYRSEHPNWLPDLNEADLFKANLSKANLSGANLHGANLHGASLSEVDLREAFLGMANLREAHLHLTLVALGQARSVLETMGFIVVE